MNMTTDLYQTETWSVVTLSSSLSEGVTPSTVDLVVNGSAGVTTVEATELLEIDGDVSWSWVPIEWSWVMILKVVSAILGITGNLLVILVLIQRRKHCRSTDTLVAALATADFLTSVFLIPIPRAVVVPSTWQGEAYCKILHPSWPKWLCVSASIYTLMAVSVERFIAVNHPIYFRRTLTRRSVSFWIVGVWLAAILTGVQNRINLRVDATTHKCIMDFGSDAEQIAHGYFVLAIRIVIPILTMLVTQSAIAFKLYRHSTRFKNDATAAASLHTVAKNRVIKMMLIVIFIYVICWTPDQVGFFGYNLGLLPPSYITSPFNTIFPVLGFYNSCAINPVIYTARHPEFREALRGLFCRGPVKLRSLFGKDIESEIIIDTRTLRSSQE